MIKNIKNGLELKKALLVAGLSFSLSIFSILGWETGKNYYRHNNKTITQENKIIRTEVYRPLSYLELITTKKGILKKVSKKSSITDKEILGFKFNYSGGVEEILQNLLFIENPKIKRFYIEERETEELKKANKTAQKYLDYFKKN